MRKYESYTEVLTPSRLTSSTDSELWLSTELEHGSGMVLGIVEDSQEAMFWATVDAETLKAGYMVHWLPLSQG